MSLLHLDIPTLVRAIGGVGVALIVFIESGVPFGFFFPGASLLFAAGLLSAEGYLSLPFLLIALPVAAILGDSVGYWLGYKTGAVLFRRAAEGRSWFIKAKHLKRTEEFFAEYGAYAVVLARFVPVVRTFVPILAGTGKMRFGLFFVYNIIGGLLWSLGITLVGYYLGTAFPQSQNYLLPISIGIIFLSLIPVAYQFFRSRGTHAPR